MKDISILQKEMPDLTPAEKLDNGSIEQGRYLQLCLLPMSWMGVIFLIRYMRHMQQQKILRSFGHYARRRRLIAKIEHDEQETDGLGTLKAITIDDGASRWR